MADTMGYTMRTLINCLGLGMFDKSNGALNTSTSTDQEFEQHLKKYMVSGEVTSVESLFKRIAAEIRDKSNVEEDYKVALVKESIPLRLVTFAHYCSDYLEESTYKNIARECFKLLGELSEDNNFCKSQLFKFESLFHLRKLLKSFDLDAFMMLFKICKEANASVFLGKEVFNMFLDLYERFNSSICKDLNIESPADNLNMENVSTLLMMTKYLHLLFSKPFLNENDKIQNMILAQETMFDSVASKYLPMLLSQTEYQSGIQDKKRDNTLQNTDFEEGQEMVLFEKIKQNGHDDHQSKLIMANHLAFWSLKLYNKFCSFGYSYKQYELMLPFCQKFIDLIHSMPFFANNDWMLPIGLEAEILTFLSSFRLLPQQNILIENNMATIQKVVGSSWLQERTGIQGTVKKNSKELHSLETQKKENGDNIDPDLEERIKDLDKKVKEGKTLLSEFSKKEETLLVDLIKRTEAYASEPNKLAEGKIYLYEGLLPLIFSYVNSIFKLNLADTSKESRVLFEQVKAIFKALTKNLPSINKILNKDARLSLDKLPIAVSSGIEAETPTPETINMGVVPSLSTIAQNTPGIDIEKLEGVALQASEIILEFIEELYDGANHPSPGSIKKDISKDDFIELISGNKFESKHKSTGLEAVKQKKLKHFIRAYQIAKESYLTREDEPNLIGFFDRNNQNLRGVFNSCLDRLLNRKKVERFTKKQTLAYNGPLSKFWTNRSVRGYVNMVAILVSRSKTGRNELYEFLHDDPSKSKEGDEEEEEEEEGEAHTARDYLDKRLQNDQEGYSSTIHREDLLATLIRVHTDLVFYLNSSSSRHDIWWVTHQTYEMISMFFKNLCECNFMKFKEYLGKTTPYLRDQNWKKICGEKTYSMVFAMELKSVMKTSRIAINKEPVMVRSDFKERVSEVLNPLLEIINEATIGPCIENQSIFLNSDTTSLCNIALRLVDDLSDDFYKLSTITLSVVIALMEGSNNMNSSSHAELKGVLEKLSSKLPASMLADRILRLLKKLYVKQLKINGDYDSKVDEKEGRGFFTALTNKKKTKPLLAIQPGYNSLPTQSEKNSPQHSKNQIMPINSEMPLDKKLGKEIGEKAEEIITEDIENSVNITHWKELNSMYMKNKEFYLSPTFEFCFRLMVLWKTLSSISKTHSNRLNEINYESNSYFKKSGLFGTSVKSKAKLNKTPSELACVYFFLTKKIMCEIEILDPQQQSVLLYFPRLPATFMLAEEAKRNYREGCDIADSNTKMVDLMRNFDLFKIKMESSYQMADKLGFLYQLVSTDAYYYYTIFCWLVGLMLNIALLVGMSYVNNSDDYVATNNSSYLAILILSILLICFSGLFFVLWLATRFVQTYRTSKEDYIFDRALKRTDELPFKAKLYIALKKSFLDQPFPMSYSLHVLFTVLGITVSPFFFTLNLLLIINFSKTTEFVLQAITLHIDQLALTLMLSVFVIFFYTLIVMDYFFDQVNVDPGNNICKELYTCFFFVFDYGLHNGGGMAESLKDLDPTKKFPGRTLFDISFFMLINVISLNIIFGIIIDTFSQLRDAQNERSKLG